MKTAIIDDHEIHLSVLAQWLEFEDLASDVKCFNTLSSFFNSSQQFDLIILDVNIPDENVLDNLEKFDKEKLLILTGIENKDVFQYLYENGVKVIVPKAEGTDVLREAITNLKLGNHYFSQHIANILFKGNQIPVVLLNKDEMIFLKFLYEGKKYSEISKEMNVSQSMIKKYKSTISKKLATSDLTKIKSHYLNQLVNQGY